MRVWYTQLNPGFWIQIQKIAGPTAKNHVWYKGFKWGFKSQLEFYVGPIANLSSPLQLFLNPSRIQIRTQFFCGSHFLPLLGPPNSFLPFSLSPPLLLCLSLSLLSAISRPLHRRRQTKKYPTKQKQTEMQKIILSVLSNGQIHGHFTAFHCNSRPNSFFHGFDSIGSTRPHQAHNDPEASSHSQNPLLHWVGLIDDTVDLRQQAVRAWEHHSFVERRRGRWRKRWRSSSRRGARGIVPWLCTSTDQGGKKKKTEMGEGGYVWCLVGEK